MTWVHSDGPKKVAANSGWRYPGWDIGDVSVFYRQYGVMPVIGITFWYDSSVLFTPVARKIKIRLKVILNLMSHNALSDII